MRFISDCITTLDPAFHPLCLLHRLVISLFRQWSSYVKTASCIKQKDLKKKVDQTKAILIFKIENIESHPKIQAENPVPRHCNDSQKSQNNRTLGPKDSKALHWSHWLKATVPTCHIVVKRLKRYTVDAGCPESAALSAWAPSAWASCGSWWGLIPLSWSKLWRPYKTLQVMYVDHVMRKHPAKTSTTQTGLQ